MTIDELVWPDDRIDHIARHGITPEEVEQACFGSALVLRAKSVGDNPVYYVLGRTEAGRFLFCVVIHFPDGRGYPVTARPMTEKETLPGMGKTMTKRRLPQTDSIQELAGFWDSHDLTDFDAELEQVREPVFQKGTEVRVRLSPDQLAAIQSMATAKGVSDADLIREWVDEKVHS